MESLEPTADLLRRTALRMFAEHGYDNVSVARVAQAAGMSHMTFFRHFPTKESVVVGDLFDPLLAEAVRAQPETWPPLVRAVRGLVAALGSEQAHAEMSTEEFLVRVRLAAHTPSLRAAVSAAGQETERAIADALIRPDVGESTARAAAGAVMGAATAILIEWAGRDRTDPSDVPAALLSKGLLTLLEGLR